MVLTTSLRVRRLKGEPRHSRPQSTVAGSGRVAGGSSLQADFGARRWDSGAGPSMFARDASISSERQHHGQLDRVEAANLLARAHQPVERSGTRGLWFFHCVLTMARSLKESFSQTSGA